MYQNRLFNRTRIQLTSFYAVVIGLITLMSGYAIHVVMMQVFDRTINRELNTLSGTVHDTLEGILQQPEIVDPVVMKVLPGLCVLDKQCSPIKVDSKDLLWLSRLEAKQLPHTQQSCCLNDLVNDLEEELSSWA